MFQIQEYTKLIARICRPFCAPLTSMPQGSRPTDPMCKDKKDALRGYDPRAMQPAAASVYKPEIQLQPMRESVWRLQYIATSTLRSSHCHEAASLFNIHKLR
jgi:hypothetical protein